MSVNISERRHGTKAHNLWIIWLGLSAERGSPATAVTSQDYLCFLASSLASRRVINPRSSPSICSHSELTGIPHISAAGPPARRMQQPGTSTKGTTSTSKDGVRKARTWPNCPGAQHTCKSQTCQNELRLRNIQEGSAATSLRNRRAVPGGTMVLSASMNSDCLTQKNKA